MNIVDQLNSSIIYVIGLAFIVGLICIKKFWRSPIVILIIYLGVLLFIEYYGSIIENNHWLYNIQSSWEYISYVLIFYLSVKQPRSKKIVLGLALAGILFLCVDLIFISGTFRQYLTTAFGFVSVLLPLMCFVYLFEMVDSEKVVNQNRVFMYWMCIGLMVYHLCNLPQTVLINELIDLQGYAIIYTIQALSSIVMYTCFMIGFIWSDPKYNT